MPPCSPSTVSVSASSFSYASTSGFSIGCSSIRKAFPADDRVIHSLTILNRHLSVRHSLATLPDVPHVPSLLPLHCFVCFFHNTHHYGTWYGHLFYAGDCPFLPNRTLSSTVTGHFVCFAHCCIHDNKYGIRHMREGGREEGGGRGEGKIRKRQQVLEKHKAPQRAANCPQQGHHRCPWAWNPCLCPENTLVSFLSTHPSRP